MKARLTGGLVAAALLGAGLVCPGAAVAADPAGYPHDLGFTPSKLIATTDAVYAVGIGDDNTAYVADVAAGTQVAIGPAFSVDAALEPGGSSLKVVTFDDDYHYWHVATDDLLSEEDGEPQEGTSVEVLGTDSVGIYEVLRGETLDLDPWGVAPVSLAESATATAADARGAGEARSWFVAGTQFNEDDTSTATLWSYSEGSGTEGAPVALGAAGDPDEYPLDVAAAQTGSAVYALSLRDNDDAPQSYGITVVQDGPDTYFPLRYPAQRIELSPDGETLYLAQSDSVLALDTDRLADYEDETDAPGAYLDASVTALAVDGDGDVFVGDRDGAVHAFGTPAAPTDLVATPDAMSTTAFSASWDEGKYSWELEGDEENLTQYTYTVRRGEDIVRSGTTFDQVLFVDEGLQPGTTYNVEVTASNGLLTSEPASFEVTTYDRYLGAPSAVAVQGSLTVGSQLSLATTGSWEAGTSVSYEWYGSNGEMGGAIGDGPTLTLTADHLGMSITGVATGTKVGAAGVTVSAQAIGTVSNPPTTTPPTTTPPVTSPPPAAATPGKLTAPKPKITGQVKVGKTLAAKAGSWTRGTKLTYHWSANGKRIKGADNAKLKLVKALKGKKISVEVTGTKAGYTTVTKESKQTAKVRR
jgi:hypothetical protein